jgi:hypothetical protein
MAEAGCIEVGRKCERSAIAGRLMAAPFCLCRSEASLYSRRPDAARLYAAVRAYVRGCCEGCRFRDAPPPTLEERERSWVVLMLCWGGDVRRMAEAQWYSSGGRCVFLINRCSGCCLAVE